MVELKMKTGPKSHPGTRRQSSQTDHRPDVIVDFIFDDGFFFISIENIGDKPAIKVSVKFDQRLMGLGGTQEVSTLPLFRNIEFMAPHKSIRTLLDSSAAYFQRREPTRIIAKITYRDTDNHRYQATIHHDLEIYQEIGYIHRSGS